MTTARYSLPLLQVGQAQKELTHNECIQALENTVQPIVEGAPRDAPPLAPAVGQQYLVGDHPSGDFSDQAHSLATWTEAGWLFTSPQERFSVVDRLSGLCWTFEGTAWHAGLVRAKEVLVDGKKVLGSQGPAIAAPSGGTLIDHEARASIGALLAAMRQHGLIST